RHARAELRAARGAHAAVPLRLGTRRARDVRIVVRLVRDARTLKLDLDLDGVLRGEAACQRVETDLDVCVGVRSRRAQRNDGCGDMAEDVDVGAADITVLHGSYRGGELVHEEVANLDVVQVHGLARLVHDFHGEGDETADGRI